jgi:hypothetical protein
MLIKYDKAISKFIKIHKIAWCNKGINTNSWFLNKETQRP